MNHASLTFYGPQEGNAFWVMGSLMLARASKETTGPHYGLVERLARPGYGQLPHIHRLEDETLLLLDGEMSGICGDRRWTATAGSFVFMPQGLVHSFQVEGEQPARFLMIFSPAGFEHFYEELGEPAPEPVLPPVKRQSPLTEAKMLALSAKYQIELQGPLAHLEHIAGLFV